jgi:adenylate cyclase
LAIGMMGLLGEHMMHGQVREASRLASEHMALIESIGDPTLTVGLSFMAIVIKIQTGKMAEALRWSQTVIDLADGDPTKGNFVFGVAVGVGAGHARHRSMGAGPCGVARRLRPGARHGPQH